MRKINRRIVRTVIAIMLFAAFIAAGSMTAEAKSGTWKQNRKGYYYKYSDGTFAKNEWIKAGKTWYYLNSEGYAQTGWKKIKGKWYYFNSNGAMKKGWLKKGGKWYYFGNNGVMKTGWLKYKGEWYYFNKKGEMVTNSTIDGYFLGKDGKMIVHKTSTETSTLKVKAGDIVWVTLTGSKFHTIPDCGNTRGATQITYEEAKFMNYKPCSKCCYK